MNNDQVRACTIERMQNGMTCAEAVLTSVLEAQEHTGELPMRVATPFSGGLGRTKDEMCGALAGGVLALGWLHGRDTPGADYSLVAELAAEFRLRFLTLAGASRCKDILTALGQQEKWDKCIRLAGDTAAQLHSLLNEMR